MMEETDTSLTILAPNHHQHHKVQIKALSNGSQMLFPGALLTRQMKLSDRCTDPTTVVYRVERLLGAIRNIHVVPISLGRTKTVRQKNNTAAALKCGPLPYPSSTTTVVEDG